MRKADFLDEIVLCLKENAERETTTVISPETLNSFFRNLPQVSRPAVPSHAVPQSQSMADRQRHTEPVRSVPVSSVPTSSVSSTGVVSVNRDIKTLDMDSLSSVVSGCTGCTLCQGRTHTVFGSGNPHADLMFIGEGPGEMEDQQGLPFVGRAGDLLTKMIAAMGLDRQQDVYIANIVKCRPPGNRNPEQGEAVACLPYLERQIELVQPKVMILLGAVPLMYLLKKRGIMSLHGKWFEYKGIRVLPTFHPAFLLRDPSYKRDAWEDLKTVMRELGLRGRAR